MVQDLRVSFDTRDGVVQAVDGVTFGLNDGETLALVGESGCGKSVTALSLMQLLPVPPARIEGQIIFHGRDINRMTEAEVRPLRGRSLAMIFQDPMTSLNPVLTIGRQISEALELHLDMDRRHALARSVELLSLVGIPSAADRVNDYPHQFSGGMRQRVMIAAALSCGPQLVLADEITTALDVTIQAQILELLSGIARVSKTGFIIITHDLGIVAGMAHRVQVMYAGQIVETAETVELFANPKMPYTWGLLRSIPRLDRVRTDRLVPIEGMPPDLTSPPRGCRFEPRCQYRREICRQRAPELLPVSPSTSHHQTRCWGTQNVPGGGWLMDVDWRTDLGDPSVLEALRQEWTEAASGVEDHPRNGNAAETASGAHSVRPE